MGTAGASFRTRALRTLEDYFDELVEETPRGSAGVYRDAREMLITWETRL